jgi:hypothetical protein
MVTACLIATTDNWTGRDEHDSTELEEDLISPSYDMLDGPSEEEAYMQGERS